MVANTHFESIFKKNIENIVKIEQYKKAYNILNQLHNQCNNIVLCADTNLLKHEKDKFPFNENEYNDGYLFISDDIGEEEETSNDDSNKWRDAWITHGTNKNKFTYDGFKNMYLKMRGCKHVCRLDRILYKSTNCDVIEFQLIDLIDGFIEPSDHFGIIAKFKIDVND
jgi:exonuclease III